MHSYTHHLGDWASHTRGLTLAQSGAYHLLIEAYYLRELPLPGDVRQVCRSIGATTTNEIAAVRYVLAQFFVYDVTRNCWSHKRCDEEIKKYQKHCEQQRAKIAKRWEHPVIMRDSQKAINAWNRQETQIRAFPLAEPPETNGDPKRLPNDTDGIPDGIPNHKPVTINTSNTHSFNAESIAATCASVCVDKGLKVGQTDSLLLALIHRGAGVADFAAAAALAVAAGKGFAYAAGIVNNRLSDAEGVREGTKTAAGSPQTDPRLAFFVQAKKSL